MLFLSNAALLALFSQEGGGVQLHPGIWGRGHVEMHSQVLHLCMMSALLVKFNRDLRGAENRHLTGSPSLRGPVPGVLSHTAPFDQRLVMAQGGRCTRGTTHTPESEHVLRRPALLDSFQARGESGPSLVSPTASPGFRLSQSLLRVRSATTTIGGSS